MILLQPQVTKIGKRYYGLKCENCDKEITRVVRECHLENRSHIFCSLKCKVAYEKKHKPQNEGWGANYKIDAPKTCQNKQGIKTCFECKLPDCTYNDYE